MEFISIQKLKTYSTNIAKKIKNGDAIYLYGEIGAGKTTFVRFLVNYLQKKNKKKLEEIVSPTFTIVQYYKISKEINIAHYDLYRIKKTKDLHNIGLSEQQDSFINIVEWPELIKTKSSHRIEIYLKHPRKINLRKIHVKYFGRFKNK
jgi:tRNA threonylcarbamoyladenosine biosynthesis protein TsaE